jgi:hypothetical protein
VAREPGADEPAIPRPLIFGVARRVDADKSAAGPRCRAGRKRKARLSGRCGLRDQYPALWRSPDGINQAAGRSARHPMPEVVKLPPEPSELGIYSSVALLQCVDGE